jgi:hypothetical protein
MATPSKALADKLYDGRGIGIQSQTELKSYLEKDLRIDPASLRQLKAPELDEIARCYRSRKIRLLRDIVRRIYNQDEKESAHA